MRCTFFFILAIVIATGCQKTAVPTYYAIGSTQIKKGLSIDSGSYFVYTDSITGAQNRYDVFAAARYDRAQELDYFYDFYVYVMKDRFGNEMRNYCECTWDNNSNRTVTAACAYTPGGAWGGNTFNYINIMSAPFKAATSDNGILCTHHYVQFYPTYTVRNQTYSNVYETDTWEISEFAKDTIWMRTYYSSDTGLVKYTSIHAGVTETWELTQNLILRH